VYVLNSLRTDIDQNENNSSITDGAIDFDLNQPIIGDYTCNQRIMPSADWQKLIENFVTVDEEVEEVIDDAKVYNLTNLDSTDVSNFKVLPKDSDSWFQAQQLLTSQECLTKENLEEKCCDNSNSAYTSPNFNPEIEAELENNSVNDFQLRRTPVTNLEGTTLHLSTSLHSHTNHNSDKNLSQEQWKSLIASFGELPDEEPSQNEQEMLDIDEW